jgi:peptide/nickel transport system ATP-binding protein
LTEGKSVNTQYPSILKVKDLRVHFVTRDYNIYAVNGVDLALTSSEALAILGESGSGKSVTLRALLRILPPHRTQISGSITVADKDILSLTEKEISAYRGREVSMVFQEPMLALDPVFTIGQQIVETVRRHMGVDTKTAEVRALEVLEMVQIPSAKRRLHNYPHEMSGGMRQRAMIALALSCRPKILLADEPTTALDATVQIQILLLLRELQKELGMAVIFVTHDIGAAVEIADRIAVMYAGRFVETGSARRVIKAATHPYTQGLLISTARGVIRGQRIDAIHGSPPDLTNPPRGCSFAPRCKFVRPECGRQTPGNTEIMEGHQASCFLLSPKKADGGEVF